ncbi:hypothetical protein [Desulfovibrio sp. DV]|uniref:hypothetical protein n=1 Tax=Desulfovibrio sp. DV TaxID=1844708 RepID=UPI000AABE575|nr:hypothetical protein [Desulfovibrio sp. DV]
MEEKEISFANYYFYWKQQYSLRNRDYIAKVAREKEFFDMYKENWMDFYKLRRQIDLNIYGLGGTKRILAGGQQTLDGLRRILGKDKCDLFLKTGKDVIVRDELKYKFDLKSTKSPEEMLDDILTNGKIDKQHLNVSDNVPDRYESISHEANEVCSPISKANGLRDAVVTIDTSFDIDIITKEITLVYWERRVTILMYEAMEKAKLNNDHDNDAYKKYLSSDFEQVSAIWNQSFYDVACYKINKNYKDKEKRGFSVDDTPRAIGIWLWDYIENTYGEKNHHKPMPKLLEYLKISLTM